MRLTWPYRLAQARRSRLTMRACAYFTPAPVPRVRMADEESRPTKRRKVSEYRTSSPLKVLCEAERSNVTGDRLQSLSQDADKEFWIIRVPRDVSVLYIKVYIL